MIKITLTAGYVMAFLFLTMLCGLSHEMVHHVTAALICGCWGHKTFNSFDLCSTCANEHLTYVATLAGPAFTFGLMWLGWYKLRKHDVQSRQLGFALIFANFPVNRMMYVLMGSNDEQWAARLIAGDSVVASWVAIISVYLVTVPVLIGAYRSIMNKRRLLWFLGFFLLPFVFIILVGGLLLEEYLLLDQQVMADTFLGIPYLLLLTEFICMTGYVLTKKYL